MQAKIQEIKDMVSYYKKSKITSQANYLKDVPYLLDALEQANKENKLLQRKLSNLNKIVDEYQNELMPNYRSRAEQSQDRERVLREALENLLPYAEDWCGDGSAIVKAEEALREVANA